MSRDTLTERGAQQYASLAHHLGIAAECEADRAAAGLAERVAGRASDSSRGEPVRQRRGIGNAAVELLDLQRRVLATTRSGADGYYVFTAVRGGNYLLRISPAQLGELGLDDPGLRPVTAPASGDIVGGMDFVLVKP